jgi:tetratricopeptide (TPR) repeat protein
MSDPGKAVFLSYASQDAAAAKRIADALRAAGVEVWFDQSELVGGDAWDQKIRKQIKDCALLIPIISAATQARTEGYFRLEWRLADQRTHLMAKGRPFLLPVVIDDTRDADARVPDSFTEVQWTRLSGGEAPPAFCARVQVLLREEPGESITRDHAQPNVALAVRRGSAKLRWVVAGIVVALGAAIGGWYFSHQAPARTTPAIAAMTPDSEARKLVRRAWEIIAHSGMLRAAMDSAAELANRAVALDSTDEEVLGPAARLDAWVIYMAYDRSTERRQRAQERASRAMAFAPKSHAARWAQAVVFAFADGSPAMLVEAEKILRSLAMESGDKEMLGDLGTVLRDRGKFAEAAAIFERAESPGSAGWNYLAAGRIEDARRTVLAQPRNAGTLNLRMAIECRGAEDLAAVYAIADGLRGEELLDEGLTQWTIVAFLGRGEPERVIRILNAFPAEFYTGKGYRGPKRYFTGLGYAMLGNTEAAHIEWRTALNQVLERLKTAENNLDLLSTQAVLLACLGEKLEAERVRRLYVSMAEANAADPADTASSNALVLTQLGRNDEAITVLSAVILAKKPGWTALHAEARLTPEFAVLRRDPGFAKLLRDTLPPGAKPFDDPEPSSSAGQARTDQGVKL